MVPSYKTVYRSGTGEITEKKSRFIAAVRPVDSEEQALAFVAEKKKEHWNAAHNCWAFSVGVAGEQLRCSDDGEPQGTAGKPILEVLQGAAVHNAVIVVTRYFGGTLLGTGGLVRAYTAAAKKGLEASTLITCVYGSILRILIDYSDVGPLQYLFGSRQTTVLESVFEEKVTFRIIVPEAEVPQIEKEIAEKTNGKAAVSAEKSVYYGLDAGQAVFI